MDYERIYSNFIESIFEEHNKDIGKANTNNTNNSIDGNNNFSSGNIEVGNGSTVGNNNLVKNYTEQTLNARRNKNRLSMRHRESN